MNLLQAEKLIDESIKLSQAITVAGTGIKMEELVNTEKAGSAVEYLAEQLEMKLNMIHDIVIKGIDVN